uniref:FHA domain-containing protein n=1 Tax=Heterorhabditis bacteriophora TaxID=37862 RepID=A0A1I7W9Q8_HETBA
MTSVVLLSHGQIMKSHALILYRRSGVFLIHRIMWVLQFINEERLVANVYKEGEISSNMFDSNTKACKETHNLPTFVDNGKVTVVADTAEFEIKFSIIAQMENNNVVEKKTTKTTQEL